MKPLVAFLFLPLCLHAAGLKATWVHEELNQLEGFELERRLHSDEDFELIASVGPEVRTYSDAGLMHNQTYVYRLRAVYEYGKSGGIVSEPVTTDGKADNPISFTVQPPRKVETYIDEDGNIRFDVIEPKEDL